jgi:DNA polymerase III alpha subunit (gram-positive type)
MEQEVSLVFDLETDGLLKDVTTIHCLAIHELETNQTISYNDQGNKEPIVRGVQRLADANCILGHNVIGYDIPILHKFYPWFVDPPIVVDTLLLSRLYHPQMMELDKKQNWKHMPLKLYGRHSLESYGYRLGEFKGSFGSTTDWKEWSQEMEDYMVQDVNVTTKLWNHFQKYLNGSC